MSWQNYGAGWEGRKIIIKKKQGRSALFVQSFRDAMRSSQITSVATDFGSAHSLQALPVSNHPLTVEPMGST